MKKIMPTMMCLSIAAFLTSCALRKPQVWTSDERSGLGKLNTRPENKPFSTNLIERSISVPVDGKNPSGEKFDLYYFVRMPAQGKATKTVLWCAGGPGQIVQGPMSGVTFADFLTDNGYNVVYFHQRGAGFSQIPASNQYDRFLKTEYVVQDIEAIRRDFLGDARNWDAIIGWSYGTILAQQYAHFPSKLDKLILIGPQSRDMFSSSPDAFDELTEAVRTINRRTLREVFDLNPSSFPGLTDELKTNIIESVFGSRDNPGIYDKAEKSFGSLQSLVDSYCEPTTQEELKKSGLGRYSPEFFDRLRLLRMFGSLSESVHRGAQIDGAKIIVNEVLSARDFRCSDDDEEQSGGSSLRVFNVVGVYDGINGRFLYHWIKNGKRVRDALKESGGEAHVNNLEKVGIADDESLRPWDPADFKHSKPALILKGGADTVSAGGQAERFYLKALTGDRTQIEFPGIGHSFGLPRIPTGNKPLLTGTVHIKPPTLEPGETRSIVGIYSGRRLDENFRLKLEPITLEASLEVAGLGILDADPQNPTRKQSSVVALIKNTGTIPIDGAGRKWTVSNWLFRGGIYLDPPLIAGNKESEVEGTFSETWPDHIIHLTKPDGLEEGLEVICVNVVTVPDPFTSDKRKLLEFWFRNNSPGPGDWTRTEWLISNGKSSATVAFEPGHIESKHVVARRAMLPSGFDVDTETTPIDSEVESDERLKGCLPLRRFGSAEKAIAIKNDRLDAVNGSNHKWQVENPMAIWSMDVDPPLLEGNGGGDKIPVTNIEVEEWKYPIMIKPADLEPGVEFRGYNIEGVSKVSVLLRNNTQIIMNPVARDWVYIDPNENRESAACFKPTTALDCVLFSFLTMGSEAFNNEEDNKVIGIARGFGAIVCSRKSDGQGAHNRVGDRCP